MSVTEEDIVDGLRTLARIIDAYGDEYWPIFERLEKELEMVQSRTSKISKYLDDSTRPPFTTTQPFERKSNG